MSHAVTCSVHFRLCVSLCAWHVAEVAVGAEDEASHLTVGRAPVDLLLVLLRDTHPKLGEEALEEAAVGDDGDA
eukprot:CAMPEP_0177713062 /NCGR_PEP_ID=MMETSP0484_2-20121128/12734_1 /TAXON_ID=354590 /ORGANISM="Rhodomonas lens, Strain RHODO" /LENGTH=73 /DNA_ID=CAMNT_0019224917 /DNA_START=111 /DNA_END=332 /DNA_ORIENTATION=+